MSSYYWFHCSECEWEGTRYRNVEKCPECRADVVRETPVDFRVACWVCGSINGIKMFAHRNDKGRLVGWLFVCSKHEQVLADKDIMIEIGVPDD